MLHFLPYDHHSVPVGTGWQKQDPEVSLHHVAFPYPTTARQQKQDPEVGLCHNAVLYPMPTIVSLGVLCGKNLRWAFITLQLSNNHHSVPVSQRVLGGKNRTLRWVFVTLQCFT